MEEVTEVTKAGLAIEVLVDTHEPVVYLLNQEEIYVGSLESCDIVVGQSEISRKHLKIFFMDGKCYVNDQGSTNGTYINDTKLVAGRRAEFLPFMSLRLGSKVLLTLISKDRPELSPDMSLRHQFMENTRSTRSLDDKTRIISLKELNEAKTQKIKKKRQDTLSKKLKESKRLREEKAALKHVFMIASMWIAVGIVLNFIWLSIPDKARKIFGVREKREVIVHVADESEESGFRIPRNSLLTRTSLGTYIGSKKCTTEEEQAYCLEMDALNRGKNGLVKTKGNAILIFVENEKFIQEMKEKISERIPEESFTKVSPEELVQLAAIKFIGEELNPLVVSDSPDTNYYVVSYKEFKDGTYKLASILAISKPSLKSFMEDYSKKPIVEHFDAVSPFLNAMGEYYQFY